MTAIEFENISKQYRLGLVSTKTLSHDIRRFWVTNILGKEDPYLKIGETNDRATKGSSDYVWALRDINFKIEQGDVLGIIGKNGAGKSTLLKLLSRVTGPTTGAIRARGRIGSLLEVGTGFHPEMTGRENIYMNGAILGMTRREIDRKLDEIIDFSGCERYIDTPVKRYSSGMTVRLGFAVAAHLEPEILVVDEVLAVGDIEFQKKAIGKMKDVSRGEGRTVLFVSHNMASVRSLCTRGMVLEKGSVAFDGDVNEAVDLYAQQNYSQSENFSFDNPEEAPGNENIRVPSFQVSPMNGNQLNTDSGIDVKMDILNRVENALVDATFQLRTQDDSVIFSQGIFLEDTATSKKGIYTIHLQIPPKLLN
ncbi:MAG: ABC transporter ATP-binding protein, partial [Bacteroidales bacterium]|nr:ABC transporter ATP-binding protein [Bacteroidales bacterium]